MGLFDGNKKTCDLCGEKMGLLGGIFTSEDLADGKTICGSCRGKCTPGELRFSAMTLDDVKANIAVAVANKKKGAAEFKATQKIKKGAYRGDDFVDIDANHGWFMNAEEKDGWVYSLDDVYYFNLDLDYAPLEEGQGFEVRTEDYPELPKIPQGVRVTDAKLVIWLADNELAVNKVEIITARPRSPPESTDHRIQSHRLFPGSSTGCFRGSSVFRNKTRKERSAAFCRPP